MREKDAKPFWRRIRLKYKLSPIDEGTLEEVWSFRLSQLSAFVILAMFAFLLIVITTFIIIRAPIRNCLPGCLDMGVHKEIIWNALRTDSLERMIEIRSLYLDNMAGVISGTMPLDPVCQIGSLASSNINYEIPCNKGETRFVKDCEEEEKYNLSVLTNPDGAPTEEVFLYKPVNGVVTSHYETDVHHYGVDLAAAPKENVLATLDGTVIYTGFDPNHGNVIQLQHKNGFISTYKHNELLLKEVRDHVVADGTIALIGNTGGLSTGPHLHFEL